MAGNEDKPGLPQRRGRKDPGDLPDGFGPIVPLFRRSKAPAAPPAPTVESPPRPLPRAAAAPAQARPAAERPVIDAPPPQRKTPSRVLAAAVAAALLVLVLLAIVLWATS